MTALPLSLLVLESDVSAREALTRTLTDAGHRVRQADSREEAVMLAREEAPQLLVLTGSPADLAEGPPELVPASFGTCLLPDFFDATEIEAALHSAADAGRARRELHWLRAHGGPASPLPRPTLAPTFDELVALAANSEAPVLLQGEIGTGKGYVARLIHDRSPKNQSPYFEIDCSLFHSEILESELFGGEPTEKTSARSTIAGLVEAADIGTIFLDQVDHLGTDMQVRLLELLEHRRFTRHGGHTPISAGVRLIVASHTPLSEAVADRRFRADLYYRLQTLTLTLPPLRARPDEILPLAETFLAAGTAISPAAQDVLTAHRWPGNVRELRDILWRAQVVAGVGVGASAGVIDVVHLALPGADLALRTIASGTTGARPLDAVEREAIRAALAAHRGNRTRAAQALGIARSTLLEKIKRYGLP
jgi:DNA-binding NtrC family response regulator